MMAALAFSLTLQHLRLPSTRNLVPSAQMIIFSALRSQLQCHLLKEDVRDPLNQSRSFSILLPRIRNFLVYLFVDCLLSAPSPLEYGLFTQCLDQSLAHL